MAFLNEEGLQEFKSIADKAYSEKTFDTHSVFEGEYSGYQDGTDYNYYDIFPDQSCVPIISSEEFWGAPKGSSKWIRLTKPLRGSYDCSFFTIINDYETGTDCYSGAKFIRGIGDKRAVVYVSHLGPSQDESDNWAYYTLQAGKPYRITKTSSLQSDAYGYETYSLYWEDETSSQETSLPEGQEGAFLRYINGKWAAETLGNAEEVII